MFPQNFNGSFQDMGSNPYIRNAQVSGFGSFSGDEMYAPSQVEGTAMYGNTPSDPMGSGMGESQLYPYENSGYGDGFATTPSLGNTPTAGYAHGGRVKNPGRKMPGLSDIMANAQKLRQHGQRQDTILAHINPQEAALLEANFGGDINPHTGLPQYGLFNKPGKWLAGSLGGGAGAVIGNMILPGAGGIIGGALGGALGSKVRGRKDYMQAGLRGAGMGAMLPSLAGMAGSGANYLGMPDIGSSLTNYGNANAILPSLGIGGSGGAGLSSILGIGNPSGAGAQEGIGSIGKKAAEKSFFEKIFDDPKNVLALASITGQYLNKEKPKSATQQGREDKERYLASQLNADEHTHHLRNARIAKRNSYLPEERLGNIGISKARHLSPEEAARTGRQVVYENIPEYKKGGKVKPTIIFAEEQTSPIGISRYLSGKTKGQDDKIPAELSDGEYVIDASTVSNLGDGNSDAGASLLDKFVKSIRKHKGGSVKLPPKAKSISEYMR